MSVCTCLVLPVRNTCYALLQIVLQPLGVFQGRLYLFYYQPEPATPKSTKKSLNPTNSGIASLLLSLIVLIILSCINYFAIKVFKKRIYLWRCVFFYFSEPVRQTVKGWLI